MFASITYFSLVFIVVWCGDKIRHHDKKEVRIAFVDNNDFIGRKDETNGCLNVEHWWALGIADIKIHQEQKER